MERLAEMRPKLSEEPVQAVIQRGDRRLAAALLAVAADVPVAVVDRWRSRRCDGSSISYEELGAKSLFSPVAFAVL